METATAIHAYSEYHATAKFLAQRFGPQFDGLDFRARSKEDYAQELRLKAITVADRFQHRVGFCLPAERRYTYKALWNRARNWRRDQQRREAYGTPLDAYGEGVLGVYSIDGQLEARETLSRLLSGISRKDRLALESLVAAGGMVSAAWDPAIDSSLKLFRRRITRLRRKAKMAMCD